MEKFYIGKLVTLKDELHTYLDSNSEINIIDSEIVVFSQKDDEPLYTELITGLSLPKLIVYKNRNGILQTYCNQKVDRLKTFIYSEQTGSLLRELNQEIPDGYKENKKESIQFQSFNSISERYCKLNNMINKNIITNSFDNGKQLIKSNN